MNPITDSLAATTEASRPDVERYVEQLFASKDDVCAFRLLVRDESYAYRPNDSHHNALGKPDLAAYVAISFASITNLFDHQGKRCCRA
jgi:hypothetical protein